jgi:small-conductance mechanosensitive channel
MRAIFYIFVFLLVILFPQAGSAQMFHKKNVANLDSTGNKKPQAINIIDVNAAIEQTKKKLSKYTKELASITYGMDIDSLLKKEKSFLIKESELFNRYNPNNLSQYFLENDYRAWVGYQIKLNDANSEINSKLSIVEDILKDLEWEKQIWILTQKELSKKTNVPVGIKQKIRKIILDISSITGQYEQIKKKLLIWDNGVTDLLVLSNDIILKISTLQRNLRDSLFVKNKPAIWHVKVSKSDIFPITEKIKRAVQDNSRIIKNFVSKHKFNWIFFFALVITLVFFTLRRKYLKAGFDTSKKAHTKIMILFDKHWVTTYFLLLLTLGLTILSIMPLSLSSLLATLMLFCVYFILPEFMGKKGKIRIIMILFLYMINEFEILMWYFGDLSRYYLFFETFAGMFITFYYGINKFKKPEANVILFLRRTYYLSIYLFTLYGLGFFTNLFGYVNLTVMLLKIAAQSATILLLIYGILTVLKLLVTAYCDLGRVNPYSALAGYWDDIEKKTHQLLELSAIFFGVKLILGVLEVYRPLYENIEDILTSELRVGNLSMTLGGILGMFLIFFLSYFLAKSIEVIFTNHRFIKKKISAGAAFAIASTIKYFLVFFGLIFGMAFAGIDIGKFSLFTGALGVGIGFGLQNIVNNFISGLILLYERPVEVGDTIEVGGLLGIVKKIGVRASRVRTYDGAEVVVPNGNIISNDLINWTLSDDKRRLEIKVGVAYGTDVNKVLKILQQVAVNNDKVFPDPAPRALFEEFGDSSLNFRLLCWIPYDNGLTIRSEITLAIYNAFAEAGVEIPFPQMDVHVKDINGEGLTQKPEVVMPPTPDNAPETVKDKDDEKEVESEFTEDKEPEK